MIRWMLVREYPKMPGQPHETDGRLYDDEQKANDRAEVVRDGFATVHVAQVDYGEPRQEYADHRIAAAAREYVAARTHYTKNGMGSNDAAVARVNMAHDRLVAAVEGKS